MYISPPFDFQFGILEYSLVQIRNWDCQNLYMYIQFVHCEVSYGLDFKLVLSNLLSCYQ